MIYHSAEMQRLLARDPALAARVALWDSCGLYVRVFLFNLQLRHRRGT